MKNENDQETKKELFAEVFGYPTCNVDKGTIQSRNSELCPYTNSHCNKSTFIDGGGKKRSLGVCSLFYSGTKIAITCPRRFHENKTAIREAAKFCFNIQESDEIVAIPEMRLSSVRGRAGNIDYTLVHKRDNHIIDFSGVEFQAVYFSGNSVRPDFLKFIDEQSRGIEFFPAKGKKIRRPDYRSSSKKRLLPQLIEKGPIFSSWGKKFCVVIHEDFFDFISQDVAIPEVDSKQADFAWIVLQYNQQSISTKKFTLEHKRTVTTTFRGVLEAFSLTAKDIPDIKSFVERLKAKLPTSWPVY